MASVPKKILIGYDGSPYAEAALRDLARAGLGARTEARVLAAANNWVPPIATISGEADAWYAQNFALTRQQAREARDQAAALAERGARQLRALFPGWRITTAAALDDAAEGILDAAAKWKASLIVLGSHGQSALSRMLLGSVSHKVLTHAPCSVRIARTGKGKGEPRRARRGPVHVLVATDGSQAARAAVAAVAARTWTEEVSVRILVTADPRLAIATQFQPGVSPVIPPWREALQRVADEAAALLEGEGRKVDAVLREGDARTQIVREAARFGADAIFIGSRGHGPSRRFLLGSTTLAVAEQATCTVEAVR